eukprot:CCRYP_016014-RA/>CCRYP_016014-RA protein AED:0.04 eAED:0.04 QI:98/1/1/1/0.5/0.33/3/392/573
MNVAGMQDNTPSRSLAGSLPYEPIQDDNSSEDTANNDEGTEESSNHFRRSLQDLDQNYIHIAAAVDLEADEVGLEQFDCAVNDEIEVDETSSQHIARDDDQKHQDRLPSLVTGKKKKVKNRHVKAAIMIAVIWTIMVGFIVISLSVDWWSKAGQDHDSCTLCGKDLNLEMQGIELTDWPTRRPSSKGSAASSLFTFLGSPTSLRPPPENIAQVCSPSIYIDYGPGYNGPSVNDLVATCANTCFPAMCCLINNEQAKLGIKAILESQGLASQAESYLSSIQNCYTDDNIATCDEYSRWCDTLYRLDIVLDDTISMEMEIFCTTSSDKVVLESSRAFGSDKLQKDCSWACNPLSCCYGDVQNSTETVIHRKRKRQHIHFDTDLGVEDARRTQLSSVFCQNFTAFEGSLNAKICDAYAPYCNPNDLTHSTIQIPSVTRPTLYSLNPTFTSNTSDFNASISPTVIFPSLTPTPSMYPSSFTMNSPSHQNSSIPISSQPTLLLSSKMSQTPTEAGSNATSSPGPSPMLLTTGPSPMPLNSTSLNITSSYAPSQELRNSSLIPTSEMTEPTGTPTTSTD